ncbi:AAA family ATPase [Candidatus Electronema sp. JM]|uniref:AAA family ATPase n=1 Tax=Candidatus Electronema sp. JM TaxID=3401571 RepID=UPI003AA85D86
MRILKLRLRNLNSLVGGWEIDFTHPAFADGIFAITGPTGAGKTTILDALCLALYGRTPRLDKVTKRGNEIMSRQSGECFAEVEFSVGKEARRCSWSQGRSRKKADGELQQPKRELSLLNGEILASSVSSVEQLVEECTGMDFDRFTRSMLLAQGGFAAFLQASPDERSPILEQITGSTIYSEISIRAHERWKRENDRQKQLEEQAAAFQLLSLEEEDVLRQELDRLRGEVRVQGDRLTQLDAALKWLKRLADLRQDVAAVSREQAGLAAAQEQFAASEQRLRLDGLALLVAGEHAALAARRKQQADDLSAAAILRRSLPELEAALKAADGRLVSSGDALAAAKAAQETGRVLITKVRELDFRLQEKRAALRKQDEACAELRRKNAADLAACGKLEQELRRVQDSQQQSAAYLAKHAADERLLTDLTGLGQQLKQLGELAWRHEDVRLAAALAEKTAAEAAQFWQGKAAARRKADELLAEVQEARAAADNEFAQLLQGRRAEELWHEQNALITLTKLLAQADMLAKERADLHEQQVANSVAKQVLAETLRTLRQHCNAARQEEEVRRIEADFAKRVLSLEEQRARLQAGQPCPLCGSPEHPYAQGGLPLLHQAELAAQAAAAALRQAEEALNKADKEQARLDQAAQHLDERLTEKNTAMQALQQQTANCCAELALVPEQQLSEIEQRLHENRQTVQAAEALTKKISQLGKTLEQRQAACIQTAQDESKAAAARDKAQEARQRLAEEERNLAEDVAVKLRAAQTELAVYGCAEFSLREIDQTAIALTTRRDTWQRHQQQRIAAEQKIAGLDTDVKVLRAGIEQRNRQLEHEEPLLQAGRQEAERLAAERAALFADKQPEAEEKRLAEAVKAAEQAVEQAQAAQQRQEKTLHQQHALISSRERAAADRMPELARQEAAFAERLRAGGFADEAAWQTAQLAEAERAALRRQAEELRDRRTQLDERRRDREARLAEEEQLALTDLDQARLEEEQAGLTLASRRTAEQIGSLTQRLADNQERRGQQSGLLRELAAQKTECLRWKSLHDLIGSADGKKYRNFAQGLTFEQMVLHSNRELARIHSRYLLLRDPQQPLELSVADFEQAGEVRSVKNLSGGESFMVSLALALGLSSMVGGKVESLFLDEGFGTLDDDALDSALARLAELRGEGRLIGVISHVAALKERIACQIEALPGSGGRSVLKGPGVRRL